MTTPATLMPARLGRAARALAFALGASAAVAASPLVVFAHANLSQSQPAADQTLAGGPDRVWLSFTEALDPAGTGLVVLDGGGAEVDLGDQVVSAADKQASVGLAALGPGVYTVAWGSRSAADGHDAKGFFAFAVGAPAAAPILAIQGPGGANPGQAQLGDLNVTLGAAPSAAPHVLQVGLVSGSQPIVDAQRVSIRLTSQAMDLGTGVVLAAPQGDGRYLATSWLPSLPGLWQAEVIVRRAGLDDVSAVFNIQTGA